jgi:hypothetical protein
MKKLFMTFFAAILLLPISSIAKTTDHITSIDKKQDEIWRVRWFYIVPSGVPEMKVTFVKLNEQGNYFVNFHGQKGDLLLKKTQDSFSGEMQLGTDLVWLNGTISRGVIQGTWRSRTEHSGTIVGHIIHAVK